ncbi:MAG: hypothetical protein NC097_05535 [Clostridium sp.]|nr:hypothetical protein [Prevotella sp.]MCM1429239.1 hypothetical protein [Clostridium sp.]MCM1475728.1 hypothetical protein [Muribaculaceae bacterium]
MKKIHIVIWVFLIFVFGSVACSKSEVQRADFSDGLYQESVELAREYILKIKNAPDSASVDSLMARYQDIIDSLNFQYPPDTDMKLTEGQNDTLTILSAKLVKTYNTRKAKLPNDSVSPKD